MRRLAALGLLMLAACQGPNPVQGYFGRGVADDPQALAKAIAAATGTIEGISFDADGCDPRATLVVKARQPDGRVHDHRRVGWSPATGFTAATTPLLAAADGALYAEVGGAAVRVGTWTGERRVGAPVAVTLDGGARWLVGFPPALYTPDGWATIRLAGEAPAPVASPGWLLDEAVAGDHVCAEVKPSLAPASPGVKTD